ncbi:hypothetical protein VNO78_09920 [Psophocarpus tetragonolobus]|uniref:Uncharacterized protein n=1 Tax=Psophocarpus tetragonolobus TaxID=3891 RepID=A0AAN9XUC5_PSOTE
MPCISSVQKMLNILWHVSLSFLPFVLISFSCLPFLKSLLFSKIVKSDASSTFEHFSSFKEGRNAFGSASPSTDLVVLFSFASAARKVISDDGKDSLTKMSKKTSPSTNAKPKCLTAWKVASMPLN